VVAASNTNISLNSNLCSTKLYGVNQGLGTCFDGNIGIPDY
jgi:hypothetical protein